MAANGIVFALAYIRFDSSKEYYYLRVILKVGAKIIVVVYVIQYLLFSSITLATMCPTLSEFTCQGES
jgi:hypothetical protein